MQFFPGEVLSGGDGCQETESSIKVLNFLERSDDRIRCTHMETVAVVKP